MRVVVFGRLKGQTRFFVAFIYFLTRSHLQSLFPFSYTAHYCLAAPRISYRDKFESAYLVFFCAVQSVEDLLQPMRGSQGQFPMSDLEPQFSVSLTLVAYMMPQLETGSLYASIA